MNRRTLLKSLLASLAAPKILAQIVTERALKKPASDDYVFTPGRWTPFGPYMHSSKKIPEGFAVYNIEPFGKCLVKLAPKDLT